MIHELLLPRVREPALILPSYVKLDMAFGVGSGTSLFDKSRYRSHGTITGADWATGAHGYCLDFDKSVPDYVEIDADYDQLDFTSDDFSMVMRAKIDSLAATVILFCRGLDDTDGYSWRVTSVGRLHFRTEQSGAGQPSYSAAGDIATDTWYTLGMSRDGASVKVYKNGVDITSVSATHIDPATSARSAKIGIYDDKLLLTFDGKIEFLRIFGGLALSDSEHLAWHNALA